MASLRDDIFEVPSGASKLRFITLAPLLIAYSIPSIISETYPLPLLSSTFIAINFTDQLIPVTPKLLSPTAPITPAT